MVKAAETKRKQKCRHKKVSSLQLKNTIIKEAEAGDNFGGLVKSYHSSA